MDGLGTDAEAAYCYVEPRTVNHQVEGDDKSKLS
jgi:hypothetical protein